MKSHSLLSFFGLAHVSSGQQRHRQAGYVFLHSTDNHHLATASRELLVARFLLCASFLSIVATVSLCLFFHFFSSLFIYLSLVLFALPITFFWLVCSPRARIASSCAYLLLICFTLNEIRLALSPKAFADPDNFGGSSDQRIFIASNLHNNEEVLPFYSMALQQLVKRLGKDNTFVSIYESHSKDKTKEMLATLGDELFALGLPHRILMDDKHAKVGLGKHRNGRIDFLSYVRNVALDPLRELYDQGYRFTHVLWINDVYFNPNAMLDLLNTDGGKYDQVCALDFIGNGFYDV